MLDLTKKDNLDKLRKNLPSVTMYIESLLKTIHDLRLKNMDLRRDQASLKNKISDLDLQNRELKVKVDTLEKKSAVDCELIID